MTFEFSTDSPSSLREAIKAINHFDADGFADRISERLCEIGAVTASSVYELPVSVEQTGKHQYQIKASGQIVCFLEFGTGMYASVPSSSFPQTFPFPISPGSWSDTHAKTYEAWVKKYGTDKNYPYNRKPKRGLWEAYKEIMNKIDEVAKENL